MKRISRKHDSEEFNIWPSYTDLVIGIFLFMMFIFIILILQQFSYSVRLAKLERFLGKLENEMDALEKEFGAGGVVKVDTRAGRIVLQEKILFDFGKADIKPESWDMLKSIGESLRGILERQPDFLTISIDGHTDNVGGYDYNLRLGSDRAAAVLDLLRGFLFKVDLGYQNDLRSGSISNRLRQQFIDHNIPLSQNATVSFNNNQWTINDPQSSRSYIAKEEEKKLGFYFGDYTGLDPMKYDISANTYGEYRPVTSYSWEFPDQNRRIEIRVVPKFSGIIEMIR